MKYLNSFTEYILEEADPKVGTGKKPKGSSRRLYTDENPKDTVPVKFRTLEDIRSTINSPSFKSKSHKRQSQILNLIEQRVRVAHSRAKDADTKKRLKRAHDYIKSKCEASKEKTKRLNESHTSDISQTIKDILLPINDMGYNIEVTEDTDFSQLIIRVVTWTNEPLLITDEIRDDFIRMKEYLQSENYGSIRANFYVDRKGYKEQIEYLLNIKEPITNLLFVAAKKKL